MTTPPAWEAWAPPLDPPTSGGLPYDQAQAIAGALWATDPHLCAALQWEAYAATLPPTPAVSAVSTGAQTVAYSPAAPQGEFGLAMQRAAWHRSFLADVLVSVPLRSARDRELAGGQPWGWWGPPGSAPPEPENPVAAFSWDPAAPAPAEWITFNGGASAGGGGSAIVRYDWLFGATADSSGPVVLWQAPGTAGTYPVQLTVTDDNGGTAQVTEQVVVA